MKRKANCAACVNINSPTQERESPSRNAPTFRYNSFILLLAIVIPGEKSSCSVFAMGVIIITYETEAIFPGGSSQDPDSTPKWDAQFPRGHGPGPLVFGGELLRPAGSDSGQVRDAATGGEGCDADQRRCRPLWLFPSRFLQSPARFYSRRVGRPHPQAARPERGAQVDPTDRGVCRGSAHSRAIGPNTGVARADSEGVFRSSASQNLGAGAGDREKKPAKP